MYFAVTARTARTRVAPAAGDNMQIALISDAHGNSAAYEAVLSDIERQGISVIANAGDLVTCDPDIQGATILRRCAGHCLRGHHDLEHHSLFRTRVAVERQIDPGALVCMVGHSRRPGTVLVTAEGKTISFPFATTLVRNRGLWIVNPGDLGDPATDPLIPSYAVLDCNEMRVTFHRVWHTPRPVSRATHRRALPPSVGTHTRPWFQRLRSGVNATLRALSGAS